MSLSAHARPKQAYSTPHSIGAEATQRGHRCRQALRGNVIVRQHWSCSERRIDRGGVASAAGMISFPQAGEDPCCQGSSYAA